MILSTILLKNSILEPEHGAHEEEIRLGKASLSLSFSAPIRWDVSPQKNCQSEGLGKNHQVTAAGWWSTPNLMINFCTHSQVISKSLKLTVLSYIMFKQVATLRSPCQAFGHLLVTDLVCSSPRIITYITTLSRWRIANPWAYASYDKHGHHHPVPNPTSTQNFSKTVLEKMKEHFSMPPKKSLSSQQHPWHLLPVQPAIRDNLQLVIFDLHDNRYNSTSF